MVIAGDGIVSIVKDVERRLAPDIIAAGAEHDFTQVLPTTVEVLAVVAIIAST